VMELGERGVVDEDVPEEVVEHIISEGEIQNETFTLPPTTPLDERDVPSGADMVGQDREKDLATSIMVAPETVTANQSPSNTTLMRAGLSPTTDPLPG
jgi:hypothetical protein